MRSAAAAFVLAILASVSAVAQITWQPSAPPLVTAEETAWYQRAEPIICNGEYYYPAGAAQGFNRYQMVRTGSYRGIPLYTDATLEPNSIVFVPLNGERMQPYERRRIGDLAGTTGSRTPSLPTGIEREVGTSGIRGALGPADFAPAYDVRPVADEAPMREADRSVAAPTYAPRGSVVVEPLPPLTSVRQPTGVNGIWIEYDGRRWYGEGKSIAYDAARLQEVGTYRGWTVYARKGDDSNTIYIPSVPGRLAPYRVR